MPVSDDTRKRVAKTPYWIELRRIAKDIGGIANENGLNAKKIAMASGLAVSTVRNFIDGTTVWPQWRTVWQMAAAQRYSITPKARKKPMNIKSIDVRAACGLKRKKKERGRRRKKS